MENFKQVLSNVKTQAESLIQEMHPVLRTTDAESFCKVLLPQLLKQHSSDSQKTLEVWQRGQQNQQNDLTQHLLSLEGDTREWRDVASLVDEAFEQCTSELSCAAAPGDGEGTDARWPANGDCGLDLDPSISLRDDSSPLRLCVCKRCSRVVLQRR